LTFFKPEIII